VILRTVTCKLEALGDSAINDLLGHSMTYRIAVGPQAGQKAFTLRLGRTTTTTAKWPRPTASRCTPASLPKPINGTSWNDYIGTSPARPWPLIGWPSRRRATCALPSKDPVPRRHHPYHSGTTRFHGVFAPNSKHRSQVTPARCGKRPTDEDTTPDQRHTAMTLAQRLKRVFTIDIETCEQCGGAIKVIASIEDPAVIREILGHLQNRTEPPQTAPHPIRVPPAYPEPD